MSIVRLSKVTEPLTAARVSVPPSVPPDGLLPIAIVTELVAVVALPY